MIIAAYTEAKTEQLAIRLGRGLPMAVNRGGAAFEPVGPNGGRRCTTVNAPANRMSSMPWDDPTSNCSGQRAT